MSSMQINPYVNFQGRAREAFELYQQALGGSLTLSTVDATGAVKPAGPEDRITQGRLEADGVVITGADGHPDYPPTVGDNMAIALSGTDKERLTHAFTVLSEGGFVKMPLTEQPWGLAVGYLADKFGITWMVTIHQQA